MEEGLQFRSNARVELRTPLPQVLEVHPGEDRRGSQLRKTILEATQSESVLTGFSADTKGVCE